MFLLVLLAQIFSLSFAESTSSRPGAFASRKSTCQGGWGLPSLGKFCLSRIRGGSHDSSVAEQQEENASDPVPHEEQVEDGTAKETSVDDDSNVSSETEQDDNQLYKFSLYQSGDGSEEDPDGIPRRFLNMSKGNRAVAQAALKATLQWRQEHDVDTILANPHANYDICKSITLHSFLGRDATGHIAFFQRPALNSGEHLAMAHKHNITNNDLVLHYVYVLEYCWNVLDPPTSNESRVMTSIIDLTGLDLSLLRKKELIGFVQQFVSMMSTHYPQRAYKTLILNAPSWFGMLYKLISPMLRESTKAKVQILSQGNKQLSVLKEALGEDCLKYLPPELLETDKKKYKELLKASKDKPLPASPLEQGLREFCCARLDEAGVGMKPILE